MIHVLIPASKKLKGSEKRTPIVACVACGGYVEEKDYKKSSFANCPCIGYFPGRVVFKDDIKVAGTTWDEVAGSKKVSDSHLTLYPDNRQDASVMYEKLADISEES